MNDIWVLSVRTSLPDTCYCFEEMEVNFFAFNSFEKAKNELRQVLKKLSFSKNAMFDGNGNLIALADYAEDALVAEKEEDVTDGWLYQEVFTKIQNALHAVFSGEDTKIDLPAGSYEDASIEINITDNSIESCGTDDGPINGYDPTLSTNLFSMQEEKDYYLYINDQFGHVEATAELYIDLKKTTIR